MLAGEVAAMVSLEVTWDATNMEVGLFFAPDRLAKGYWPFQLGRSVLWHTSLLTTNDKTVDQHYRLRLDHSHNILLMISNILSLKKTRTVILGFLIVKH